MINQIYDYLDAGFKIFGLHGVKNGICECGNPKCEALYKHPRISGWQYTPHWSTEQIDVMIEVGQFDTGFGVLVDGYLVVDVDARNGGVASLERLGLPSSGFVVATGSGNGSKHIYYRLPPSVSLRQKLDEFPGIDFKTSGYVVGAGSMHASGDSYEIEQGFATDIPDAPAWLIDKLKRPEHTRASINGQTIDVSIADIKAALSFIDPDCDYNQWIKTGMSLHHSGADFDLWDEWSRKGTKYPGREYLDRKWHSFGKHPGDAVTIGTLYRYAEESGYQRPVTFIPVQALCADTPVSSGDTARKPLRQKIIELALIDEQAELARIASQPWLIDEVLPGEAFGTIYGESGTGKSFIALDMAAIIATGGYWSGHETGDPAQVVYISAEGGNGLRIRKKAWEQARNISASRLKIIPIAIQFGSANEFNELYAGLSGIAEQTKAPIKLIIIDTLARSIGGDENTAKDMGAFVQACDMLKSAFGCTVMVVHHSGKDADKGARGSSALRAACDFEIMISGNTAAQVSVVSKKAKDVAEFPTAIFSFDKVEIEGLKDHKGRPLTSLVPSAASFGATLAYATRPTDREAIVLDILRENNGCMYINDLRQIYYNHENLAALATGSKRKAFERAMDGLLKKFLISERGETIYLSGHEV